ncbi:MAG: FAD-dependent oxidoreductase [Micrococcales bacterium]|nr:FAD-dependent oxidoreductase [Micrococcales bacterium]
MFQHFGSQVTVLDSGEQFLRRAEPVVAESVHQVLTKSGVLVRQSARVQQIRQDGEALTLELADGQVQADGGVLEPLPPLMADEDVVGAPLRAELLADGGELSDQLPQRLVVRRPACLGPQQGDGGGGTGLPVDEEVPRTGTKKWSRAKFARPPRAVGLSNMGACRALPSAFTPSTSRRPLRMTAAEKVIESSIHCTCASTGTSRRRVGCR